MMRIVMVAALSVALLGLADIGFRLVFGKGGLSEFEDALVSKVVETRREEKPHGEKPKPSATTWSVWLEAMECFTRCGADKDCCEACPKPWKHMEGLCNSMQPVFKCHSACRKDFACLEKCLLPPLPKTRKRVQESLQCHRGCSEGDRECHGRCRSPVGFFFEAQCSWLLRQVNCHEACGYGNLECNHQCGFPFVSLRGRGEGKLDWKLKKIAGLKKYMKVALDRMHEKEEITKAKSAAATKDAGQDATNATNTSSLEGRKLQAGSEPAVHV